MRMCNYMNLWTFCNTNFLIAERSYCAYSSSLNFPNLHEPKQSANARQLHSLFDAKRFSLKSNHCAL